VIGQGRAAELLYTGRSMSAEEGLAWGFFNRVADPALPAALEAAAELAAAELRACHDEENAAPGMERQPRRGDRDGGAGAGDLHADAVFRRAYEAFAAKRKPVFEGD